MLGQKVVIKGLLGSLYGKEGIIVAVKSYLNEEGNSKEAFVYCKVRVGDKISNWLPYEWLRIVSTYSMPA